MNFPSCSTLHRIDERAKCSPCGCPVQRLDRAGPTGAHASRGGLFKQVSGLRCGSCNDWKRAESPRPQQTSDAGPPRPHRTAGAYRGLGALPSPFSYLSAHPNGRVERTPYISVTCGACGVLHLGVLHLEGSLLCGAKGRRSVLLGWQTRQRCRPRENGNTDEARTLSPRAFEA